MRLKIKLTVNSLDSDYSFEYKQYPSLAKLINSREEIHDWLLESLDESIYIIEEGNDEH